MLRKEKSYNYKFGFDAKNWRANRDKTLASEDLTKDPSSKNLFFLDLINYLFIRTIAIFSFTGKGSERIYGTTSSAKAYLIRNIFIGRGSMYRNIFQGGIALVTLTLAFTGFFNNISLNLNKESVVYATGQDFFTASSGGASTVTESKYREDIVKYTVKSGDTLSKVAEEFGVSVDSITWANDLKSQTLKTGQSLDIPPVDGVIHKVKSGDSLKSLAAKYKASEQAIADWNWLDPPDFKVYAGDTLIIPGGQIEKPTQPIIATSPKTYSTGLNANYQPTASGSGLRSGTFGRPVEPGCGILSQGYKPWHQAIDVAQSGGCKVTAIDGGTVTTAGWTPYGYAVYINHGGGWTSRYGHGTGTFYVSAGQKVSKGQPIMYMGCTGRCTGTHVHLEIYYNGIKQNPLALINL